jgi:adenylate cyclase
MAETRKLAAILVADIVGYSRLAGADEDTTLARLRALRSDLIDPTTAVHNGRVVKRTGDGSIIEFRSVVDAVRCAIEVQNRMVERNAGLPPERRMEFRVGIHLGDVVEETDGDLMGDGVNIAARLEGIAEPGGICLSEDAWRQVQGKVAANFVDTGDRRLKNIPRPVRAFHLTSENATATRPTSLPLARRLIAGLATNRPRPDATVAFLRRNATLAGFLILLVIAAPFALPRLWPALEAPHSDQTHPPTVKRSIAVLPFKNMSGDQQQDYFADGLSDDLITRLSEISDLLVIARSSMSAFKGRAATAQEVGQTLDVQYVLEGSVRKSGNRVRINANLIHAIDAHQVWAEQYDEEISNIFTVQDEVISRIISALTVQLTDLEQSKLARAPTKNLEAYDYYLRAENEGYYNLDAKAPARAMAFYGKAIELDPSFADAQAGYARAAVQILRYDFDYLMSSAVARKRAYDAAGRALELDPNNSRAYVALAVLQLGDGRHADSIASARRAVNLDPSDSEALANLGMILAYSGEPTEAVAVTEQALRLNPSPAPGLRELAGIVFYNVRQYDRAIEEMKTVSAVWPAAATPHEHLAAAYAHLGRLDLARSEAGALLDYEFPKPSLAIARLWYGPYYKRAEDLNHHLEGLKAAGIPEWPFAFEGRAQDQIVGQALLALTVGHTWTGYVPLHLGENTPFILQTDQENRVVYKSPHTLLSGIIRFEDNQLCMQFDGYLSNLWLCGAIYRLVPVSKDADVSYVYVLPEGLRYFSITD